MQTTLIRGAKLIDGTGGPAVEPAVLLTARGVSEAVGAMRPGCAASPIAWAPSRRKSGPTASA